jgi:hypothetical protein
MSPRGMMAKTIRAMPTDRLSAVSIIAGVVDPLVCEADINALVAE